MSTVSLSSLMQPSKTVELDFPGYPGFKVKLCFLAREELVKIRKKCTTQKWDRKTHQPSDVTDDEKFLREYVSAVIKDWTGFKFSYLEEFLLVDLSSVDPEDELPFSVENAYELMKNSDTFDTWVTEASRDLENFTGSK